MFDKILDWFTEQNAPKPNKFTRYMGEQIRKAREEANISQDKLAQTIYKRRATLSDIENGKVEVESGTLALLAYALKKPLTYFYPSYLVIEFSKEKFSPLEQEMLLHFEQIYGDELQKTAIKIIKKLSEIELLDLYNDITPYAEYWIEEEKHGNVRPSKRPNK